MYVYLPNIIVFREGEAFFLSFLELLNRYICCSDTLICFFMLRYVAFLCFLSALFCEVVKKVHGCELRVRRDEDESWSCHQDDEMIFLLCFSHMIIIKIAVAHLGRDIEYGQQ